MGFMLRATGVGHWYRVLMVAALVVTPPLAPRLSADDSPIATAAAVRVDVFRDLKRVSERLLAPGIVHEHWLSTAPLDIQVLRVDLSEPTVELEAVPGADNLVTRERPSSVVARLGSRTRRAVAAINADMGARGRNTPMAMFVRQGELLVSPSRRTVLALTEDRRAHIGNFKMSLALSMPPAGGAGFAIEAVNRAGDHREAVLFTEHFVVSEKRDAEIVEVLLEADGKLTVPQSVVGVRCVSIAPTNGGTPIAPGTMVLQLTPKAATAAGWSAGTRGELRLAIEPHLTGLKTVCGGVPRLLRDGAIDIPWQQEGVSIETFATARHPRTGAGIDASGGILILATTDGRQPGHSIGLTLEEHAQLFQRLGAHQACNFDGGGSTTMVIDGLVANKPSDTSGERATTSSLVIFSTHQMATGGESGS